MSSHDLHSCRGGQDARRAALRRVTENSAGEVGLSRIVRWSFVLLIALATSAGAQVRQPLPDDSAQLWLEAVNPLQDQDTMPFLDTARVRLVAGALRAIRRELPQLADIPAGPDWSFLVLMPTDSGAIAMLSVLRKFGTSTDSDWVVRRNTIGIPPTPVEEIVMLDDESLCQRASQAVDSQLVDGSPLGGAVYLARFGDFYAVYPPTLHGGEWSSIGFFDSTFVLKKALAW